MKHRLFWKFLLAFWVTLLLVALLAALGGWLLQQQFGDDDTVLDTGPRAAMLLDTVQATLLHSGTETVYQDRRR
ncbi:MAG: hypothetical protein Q4A16_02870 [Lautropia sp.]|nr:hypothetical protein [Lautropia sp.]